jgi:hypothetical protein
MHCVGVVRLFAFWMRHVARNSSNALSSADFSLNYQVTIVDLLHRIGHFLELANSVVAYHRIGQFHLIDQFDVELVIFNDIYCFLVRNASALLNRQVCRWARQQLSYLCHYDTVLVLLLKSSICN